MKKNKVKRALLYIILGAVILFATMEFVIYMYISGTFLANRHIERYILYAVSAVVITASIWCINEGGTYIIRRLKRGKRR